MEPYAGYGQWFQTPQDYRLGVQNAYDAPQSIDPFASYAPDDILALAPPPQYAGAAPSAPDAVAPEEAERLTWKQRLADRAAGPLGAASSREDRDMAMRRGMGEFGNMLIQAALAPDARSRAAVLARALPQASNAFRKELAGIIDVKRGEEDRAAELTKREREGERYEYDKSQRKRTQRDQARGDEASEALLGQADEWRATFDSYLSDNDVNENERGALSAQFNTALAAFEKNPSPAQADRVLSSLVSAAKAANKEEELQDEVAQEHAKAAAGLGLSVDEYVNKYLVGKRKNEMTSWTVNALNAAEARARAEENAKERELNDRLRGLQGEALDSMMAGTPKTLPDGTVIAPDTPGINFLRPQRASGSGMADRIVQSVIKEEDFGRWLEDPSVMPPSISGSLAALGVKTPEEFMALVQSGGGEPPPSGVRVPRGEIEALMSERKLTFDAAIRLLESSIGKKVVVE